VDVAEIIVAVATSATALFAWLSYRYQVEIEAPILECDEPIWTEEGDALWFHILLMNQAQRTLVFQSVRPLRPKRALLGLRFDPNRPPAKQIAMDLDVRGRGTTTTLPFVHTSYLVDKRELDVHLFPPSGWFAGKVCIEVVISDKSLRPRQRRFVIRKFIQPHSAIRTTEETKQID